MGRRRFLYRWREGKWNTLFLIGQYGRYKTGLIYCHNNNRYMGMAHSLEHLLTIQSFVLWIKGECSPRETKHWDAWLSEHPTHEQLARKAGEIVEAVHSEYEIPDPQVELQKLSREMNRRKRQPRVPLPSHPNRSTWGQHTRAAAAGLIFVIALLGGLFAYQYGPAEKANADQIVAPEKAFSKEYTTGYGEKVTFRLSDGSSIMLNANSNLQFSSKIKGGLNTQIWLQGEAYFDIVHLEGDRQRTFTVHTRDGNIQVLGTRFAVNTFGGGTQTALEQGKIDIRIKEEDDSSVPSTEYELKPGEIANFTTNDNKITVKEADMRLYTSWIEDKFAFAQTPMQEVARRIERTFGVEVMIEKNIRTSFLPVPSGAITWKC